MLEILFRGKQADTGKWVEGSLLVDERNNSYIGVLLQQKETSCYMAGGRINGKTLNRFVGVGFAMVEPETVGQFTGLVDRNGKKIFVGDILESSVKRVGQKLGNLIVVTDIRECKYMALYVSDFIVIGNIHDNPELLEVK